MYVYEWMSEWVCPRGYSNPWILWGPCKTPHPGAPSLTHKLTNDQGGGTCVGERGAQGGRLTRPNGHDPRKGGHDEVLGLLAEAWGCLFQAVQCCQGADRRQRTSSCRDLGGESKLSQGGAPYYLSGDHSSQNLQAKGSWGWKGLPHQLGFSAEQAVTGLQTRGGNLVQGCRHCHQGATAARGHFYRLTGCRLPIAHT